MSSKKRYSQQRAARTAASKQPAMATATAPQRKTSSYAPLLERFNNMLSSYSGLPAESAYQAFSRAIHGMENMAPVQNQRVKALNPLPADYSKNDLNIFLREPATHERPLRQIAEGLSWTAYPFQKIVKTYADIPTFRHYVMPQYIEEDTAKKNDFLREWRLVDKIVKKFGVEEVGHKATGQANKQGKVFYIIREDIDRVHNKVNSIYTQQLPSQFCEIIGFNNVSGYTISFDMMYFMQMGTDWTQFGDLFEPFIDDFYGIFSAPKSNDPKYVYSSYNDTTASVRVGDKRVPIYLAKVNKNGAGSPRVFMQNGRWCYYVSLPIDRVWTFEIDDTTAIVASPFAGLFQTLAQQADYEAAQLSLIMNPLIKIFTGEIPYYDSDGATTEDTYKLSEAGRLMFLSFWNELMALTNTGGAAFYMAPVENIKSHDYSESANANDISSKFLSFEMSQTGLTAIVPVTDSPHQGVAEYSAKLESRFTERVYRTLEKMVNHIFEELNLRYEWKLVVFGSVYLDDIIRSNALKQLDKGDLSQHFILAALDGVSILDRLSMSNVIIGSGLVEKLIPPTTSYTMSGSDSKSAEGNHNSGTSSQGAPTKTETEVEETKREKQTEGVTTE